MAGDDFSSATLLSGTSASDAQSNQNATTEAGEPEYTINNTVFRSLWWKWTPPSDGRATFTTVGSDGSSGSSVWSKYLGVFLGSDISDLRLCSRALARFPATTIPVTAGQVYQIGIGSDSSAESGTLVLSVDLATDTDINALNIGPRASASNDLFGNRVRLTGQFISTVGYGNYAGIEALEPVNAGFGTLWWTYTAPATGTVSLSTVGSSTVDNKYVSVWTGGSLPGLSQVIRSSSARNPSVSFAASQGTTYQIAVGAVSSSDTAGTVVLSLGDPPGTVDPPVADLVVDKAVRLRWPTELNVSYRVRGSTDLLNWSNIGSAYVGTGGVMETFQVALPDAKFFQVYSP